MDYYKNNTVYHSPITTEVDGVSIELTENQLYKVGYLTRSQLLTKINKKVDQIVNLNASKQEVLDSIGVQLPSGSEELEDGFIRLPFKLGFKWQPRISNDSIAFELVQDEDAVGLENSPILYMLGVKLIPNAFYLIDGKKYVYMGEKGVVDNLEKYMADMEEW